MFLYDFATKTAQKPDTVATYIRRNEKIFKNHVERREKQLHGVNLILNKGMTGIWIARRYWLFFYIEEPIYPSVYHVFWGGGQDYFLQASFFIASSSA